MCLGFACHDQSRYCTQCTLQIKLSDVEKNMCTAVSLLLSHCTNHRNWHANIKQEGSGFRPMAARHKHCRHCLGLQLMYNSIIVAQQVSLATPQEDPSALVFDLAAGENVYVL